MTKLKLCRIETFTRLFSNNDLKCFMLCALAAQVLGDNDTTPLHYCAVYRKFKKSSNTVATVKLEVSSNLTNKDLTHTATLKKSAVAVATGVDSATVGALFDPKIAMNKIAKVKF